MRMLVIGREGQVARSLVERGAIAGDDILALGRPELDLSGQPEAVIASITATNPQVIVSAAAYTSVDIAESEPQLAFAVNERGAEAVARAASMLEVPLIHLSTDYVFDGEKPSPYCEADAVNPIGVYGSSKLAGERAVLASHDNVAVVRTAWIYSPFGTNFVKTMLQLANSRQEIPIVEDQLGNPTSALDLADGILAIAHNLKTSSDPARRGVFHMCGAQEGSWADFAESIFEASAASGGPVARVKRIGSADYPTMAARPPNSRLDCRKAAEIHGVRLPPWRDSLKPMIKRLIKGVDAL
jgi:dTDP-4-dehydrorhamnose reductase